MAVPPGSILYPLAIEPISALLIGGVSISRNTALYRGIEAGF
jgi:hypothetical protein